MTRKDYIRLAEALDDSRPVIPGGDDFELMIGTRTQALQWMTTVEHLAGALAGDNPRFDKERFFDACKYYLTRDAIRRA